jgi:hypothetical protein
VVTERKIPVDEELIKMAYLAFNARDIDAIMTVLHPDVEWPNAMDGGVLRGHDAVRAYWTAQFLKIDPHVNPISFENSSDGKFMVYVHVTVRDLSGTTLRDDYVQHVYTIEDDLIKRMEIRAGG